MKKTAIASVALAAALFAVSCQKENTPVQNVSGPMTISAMAEGLGTPTKTELAFKYDVLWSGTDKIYVKDASGNNDTFSLTGGAGTTKGTFKQDGQVSLTGEVEAYYPATMLESGSPVWPASQTNDQTIPMYCKKTLSGTTDERMDFSSLGSVLQIVFNTTQENVTLKSIEIKDGSATLSGAFTVDTDGKAVISATDKAGITLDLGTGVALGKAANYFNIAVPAGDYQDLTLVFTATDGKKCTMTGGKVNIAYNAVGRLTLMGEKFKADVPDGALPGVFTVSDNGGETTKQIYFSQGNLYYDGSKFKFEANQYDTTPASDNSWSADHISHFYWSKDASVAYAEGYNDGSASESDVFFTNETETISKNSFTVNVGGTEQTGWRTLSNNEWQYLFNSRTDAASKVGYATVGGVHGIIILPDTFTDPMKNNNGNGAFVPKSSTDWTQNVYTSGDNWNAMESAGAVFLPAAGFRDGSDVYYVGVFGEYWSSTAADDIDRARLMWFSSDVVSSGNFGSRNSVRSVRLITELGAPAPQVISVESVSLNKSTLELAVGSDETLTATVTPDNATDKNVSWSSSDESVATVDASGKVTAVAAGTATITVTTTDGGKTTTCAVTVIPAGALAGEFSVSATKTVYFSQGNLTYNVSTTTWAFYEHQYDCATGYDSNLISLFTWGYGTWSTSPNGTDYQTGDFTDWGSKIGDGNTWRTLTTAEWQYLFNYGDYTSDVRNGKYKWATVNGVNGYVIAPDDFSGELSNTYADDAELAIAGNLVFLPVAGYRNGSDVYNVGGYGSYWSSTAFVSSSAYRVRFDSGSVRPGFSDGRDYGCSVRLITESN